MQEDPQSIIVTKIVAEEQDPSVAARIHALAHEHKVETIFLDREDMARRRLRVKTDHGSEYRIALPRELRLFDGAILVLELERAVVVRQEAENWLSLNVANVATALELGYFAGNMHWRVRFNGEVLHIAATGELENILNRLEPLLASGAISRVDT